MNWQVTYNGSMEVKSLVLDPDNLQPDLTEQATLTSKMIRKSKHDHTVFSLSLSTNALQGSPQSSDARPLYQPIGRIVHILAHMEKALKRTYLFTYICTEEGSCYGSLNAKYICHTFKCKSEDEANAITYAAARMISANAIRKRPADVSVATTDEKNEAMNWWNACNSPLYHFRLNPEGLVTGCLNVFCQVDSTLRTAKKVVKLDTQMKGDELVTLLAEKFNLGTINTREYAVFAIFESTDQHMLEDDANPLVECLKWRDPYEGTFWLKRLPAGLVRMKTVEPASETAAPQVTVSSPPPTNGLGAGPDTSESPLGPLLPFHQDDEDLLLNVMIKRQSGTGLGFKLTPAYLLQMCIAYCSLNESDAALKRLLGKIVAQIKTAVDERPEPDMLLFWASNSLKLLATLGKDQRVNDLFAKTHKPDLEKIILRTLSGLTECKTTGKELPAELAEQYWETDDELKALIIDYYRSLDSNMSHTSLNDVVERITAAMPSPQKRAAAASAQSSPAPSGPTPRGPETPVAEPNTNPVETPNSVPLTSTPILRLNSPDGNGLLEASGIGESNTDEDDSKLEPPPHYQPLPDEWEELVDQDTKHRFFANHNTRQTSWTDPRDKLSTVTLEKGDKGLGLGISGAKRTWDNRLVLGIFVSSLVPGSAAATEGSLREGDEILEVNGHSLIGVSREGAIEFLKQVQFGQTVQLLVSQEPRSLDKITRHTAL